METIGFVGLGAMGSRMATRLLQAGHTVTVWNRHPVACAPLIAGGAKVANTPRAAASRTSRSAVATFVATSRAIDI